MSSTLPPAPTTTITMSDGTKYIGANPVYQNISTDPLWPK